ncbi:MAG: hypothetical protein IJL56_06405 [Bacteroidales bacterium]|nr:hypothetical protein [Bacteroidales bacterium]
MGHARRRGVRLRGIGMLGARLRGTLMSGALLFSLTVHAQSSYPDPFECYRSFTREPEMARIFSQELGVKTRCFFASNTINSRGGAYCQYPPIWVGEGKYEFEHLDEQMEEMNASNPDGKLICMIDLDSPYWMTRRFKFDSFSDVSTAVSNPTWMKMMLRWMKDFITYAEAHHGDRIGAYVLSGGCTSEWYDAVGGYPTRSKENAWLGWCRDRGLDHGDAVPSFPSLNQASFDGHLYDPVTESAKIDYWRFHNEVIADAILTFAREARSLLPEGKKIGVFFGYHFNLPHETLAYGHLEYERVYASPDIDFFIAPGSYFNRGIGGGSGSQAMFRTAMLNGKQFLHEIDFTPHDYPTRKAGWKTEEDDIAGNTREACYALIHHISSWWFDMWGGFYDNPRLRERIGQMETIQKRFRSDRSPSVAEILLVGDPKSMYFIRNGDPLVRLGAEPVRNQLSMTGAPYDCCSFSDLERMDLSRYKVILLPQLFFIDGPRAKILREKVCRDGRTLLFAYAPGICDGKTLDPERVRTWTGVPFVSGRPDMTETVMDGWTAVYSYRTEAFTTETLRDICRRAGVLFYVEDCIPVFANERLLSIHCKEGGRRTVTLPKKASQVIDLLSGEVVAKRKKSFQVDFASPDTRLFEIIP